MARIVKTSVVLRVRLDINMVWFRCGDIYDGRQVPRKSTYLHGKQKITSQSDVEAQEHNKSKRPRRVFVRIQHERHRTRIIDQTTQSCPQILKY